jgi:hypothetical protein
MVRKNLLNFVQVRGHFVDVTLGQTTLCQQAAEFDGTTSKMSRLGI